jgi:peptide/nickel transport system permease protein
VRAETRSIKEREFVQYAQFSGISAYGIIIRHVIPAAMPTIITAATTSLANAIMTESSLSFLGVGVQQPMSSWGSLLQDAQGTMQSAPYMALIPGLLIVITIFSFNKLGNLLRIYADPRVMSDERG